MSGNRSKILVVAVAGTTALILLLRSRRKSHISFTAAGIDLQRYPIHDLSSPAGKSVIEEARRALATTGCASFPGFLTDEATAAAAAETQEQARDAFVTDDSHTAWQLPQDSDFPAKHVRNTMMRTRVASLAYDQVGYSLRALYTSDLLLRFIEAVVGRKPGSMHRLADPLGACSVNVFRPGWSHAWHFDESEYTTTLCLQQAEVGGSFVFTPPLRSAQAELKGNEVAAVLRAHSEYSPESEAHVAAPTVTTARFEPGTLQIFGGRYCLHCVEEISGTRDRLVAVLCFATEPGVVNSASVQKMFWGRTAT
mmetsp:Transcript_58941/g.127488  ORF Transcript_58941/g.127488 Transcript_58941/m.127488 type:complete len:310 (+) Transcript_58941:149-1078(+)